MRHSSLRYDIKNNHTLFKINVSTILTEVLTFENICCSLYLITINAKISLFNSNHIQLICAMFYAQIIFMNSQGV